MQVDFYILNDTGSREHLACRLIEKAYSQQQRIHLHAQTAEHAQQLDELLWTFHENNFLPHEQLPLSNTQLQPLTPITISHQHTPPSETKILLNLAADIPDFYRNFDRIIEIINQDETTRQQGRKRFAYYREQGYNLQHHNLTR